MEKQQKYTIRQIGEDLAHVNEKILSVLEDHEVRLQELEANVQLSLSALLKILKSMPDSSDKTKALLLFNDLCGALGIVDLEAF